MKITKDNYNELKSKDLENNYAKVWHVNEIREELLANTGSGSSFTSAHYTLPSGEGDIDITTNSGVVTIEDAITSSGLSLNLMNSDITTTSTIIATLAQNTHSDVSVDFTITAGNANVRITNFQMASNITNAKISYLIIY